MNLDSYVQGMIVNVECSLSSWLVVYGKSYLQDGYGHSFIKCGISIPSDGSRDDEINQNGLKDYTVDSEDEDPEDDVEDQSVG